MCAININNESKNSLSISNESKNLGRTWGDTPDITWGEADFQWGSAGLVLQRESKNSLAISNESKV